MRKLVFAFAVVLIGVVSWKMLQVKDHNLRFCIKEKLGHRINRA